MASTSATVLLAAALLAGFPWLRHPDRSEPATPPAPAVDSGNRVAVLASESPDYRSLRIPDSVKTDPAASVRLVVFRRGVCILDRGLRDARRDSNAGDRGSLVVQESGVTERAAAAPDGRDAVVATTRFVSRVDMTPGVTSTKNDTVTGATTLTLIDPDHPDGRWQLTLEDGRWVKDLIVLPASSGVVLTTFLPRNGPTDLRILDATGREKIRVPETRAEILSVKTSCEAGCFVAAAASFKDLATLPEQGVMVFDVARGTSWTYGWRYGSGDEPESWSIGRAGVLTVKVPGRTRRFDATGRPL